MTAIDLSFIQCFRDRHKHMRYYFRKRGHKRIALPGAPGSPEFLAAYQAAMAGTAPPTTAAKPGTMAALITSWLGSGDYKALKPSTKAWYRRITDGLRENHGPRLVAEMEAEHVRKLLDAKSDTPAAANRLLSVLRTLMQHAVNRGMRRDNPTAGVRRVRYKEKPFPTWAEEHIAAFEARWPTGTRARLALSLLLYTGQRSSDVIRMGRQHMRGGRIDVTQKKTASRLLLPIHPALQAEIDALGHDHLTFLMTEKGKPFASTNALYNWFMRCCAAAGLPTGLSPHGLRKAAARRLAEAGATSREIMAVTGHRTLKEAEHYTRDVDQAALAVTAIARIGRTE